MAKPFSDMSANELQDRISQLRREKEELSGKLQKKEEEIEETLKYADMAIVETSLDWRIINSTGAIEYVFYDVIKKFERGENLVIFVKKITKTSKCIEDKDSDNTKKVDLDPVLTKYIDGRKDEKFLRMLGERDDGELFLLEWTMKKIANRIKSFFKMVPSNKVIKDAQDHLEEKLEKNNQLLYETFEMLSDGVMLLDLQSRIKYISQKAQDLFIPKDNKVLRSVQFEGRMMHEVMLGMESEEAKNTQDEAKRVIITKEPAVITKSVNKKSIEFHVNPLFDEKGSVGGILIVTQQPTTGGVSGVESQKLMAALRNMSEDNKVMTERIKELEYNHKWFMKNNKEYQQTIKQLYSFLENTPMPLSIQELPGGEYRFINKELEKKLGKQRSEVLGKKDKDLLTIEEMATLDKYTEQAVMAHDVIHIEENGIVARQVCLYNTSKDATHLIRMFYDRIEEK